MSGQHERHKRAVDGNQSTRFDATQPQASPEPTGVKAFAKTYGWRAYAIPVLAVITVWVLFDVFAAAQEDSSTTTTAASDVISTGENAGSDAAGDVEADESSSDLGRSPNPADQDIPAVASANLPPGGEYTEKGEGTFRVVGTPGAKAGKEDAKEYTYVVEVEDGIDTSAYGGDDAFAAMVDATLTAAKGWTHDGRFAFRHVSAGDSPDLRIQLTSVESTHELCGHDIEMETSCFYSVGGRVALNESRWVRGAAPFQGDLGAYRQYLINHEVGHGIGFASHEMCSADGELAPIMMQQTLSLSNAELYRIDPDEVYEDNDAVCRPNPWPYPYV